jgi:O-6-methylguanine DNA methyltransferase
MGSLSGFQVWPTGPCFQAQRVYWQLFPSVVGPILAAGLEAEETSVGRRLIFLGIDSSYCSVEKDFTHWVCVQKKCAIEQKDWLGDLLPSLQGYIAEYWGAPLNGQSFTTQPFPLDLLLWGTPFQVRVWQGLLAIPYGYTVSYSELAERLGCSTAVRAVASAVAANPISLYVPCHRIVQKNGQSGQFHWGQALKEQLLSTEKLRVFGNVLELNVEAC